MTAVLSGVGLVCTGVTTTATAGATSPPSIAVPGPLVALSAPATNGLMWVLTGTAKKALRALNVTTGKVLYSESVSPYADSIGLSSNGAILAVGTAAGLNSKAAILWYDGSTGRFLHAAFSPVSVTTVAVNGTGRTIYSVRDDGAATSEFVLGTANGLGFDFALPGAAVAVTPTRGGATSLALTASGVVNTLVLPGGTFQPGFPTGAPGRAMALGPDNTTLYVLHAPTPGGSGSTIAVVDLTTGSVVRTIAAGAGSIGIALSPDGRTLYEGMRSSVRAISV